MKCAPLVRNLNGALVYTHLSFKLHNTSFIILTKLSRTMCSPPKCVLCNPNFHWISIFVHPRGTHRLHWQSPPKKMRILLANRTSSSQGSTGLVPVDSVFFRVLVTLPPPQAVIMCSLFMPIIIPHMISFYWFYLYNFEQCNLCLSMQGYYGKLTISSHF